MKLMNTKERKTNNRIRLLVNIN